MILMGECGVLTSFLYTISSCMNRSIVKPLSFDCESLTELSEDRYPQCPISYHLNSLARSTAAAVAIAIAIAIAITIL
jgi:hypothetical protein